MRRSRLASTLAIALALGAAACSSEDESVSSSTPAVTTDAMGTAATTEPVATVRDDWGPVFASAGVAGTFVARRVGEEQTLVWDLPRATTPRLPASTFKILNSMVILQTDTVADVDEMIQWDGVEREVAVWNRDHSLRSGIEVSAVWMYQELARRVGEDQMASWVRDADYGNADIGGGVDQFWLNGDLRISPFEQLDFLERTVAGDLPFDDDVVAEVREILIREQGDGWSWSHKTGTALSEDPTLGWLVGTTEWDGDEWVFAMNVDLAGVDGAVGQIDPQVRQSISRELLQLAGALPG